MKKLYTQIAALFVSVSISASSLAGLIIDTEPQDQMVGWWSSYSYSHNINDNGFILGSATGGLLEIEIYDDNRKDCFGFCKDQKEVVAFTIEALDFDTGGISFGDFSGDLEVNALLALNTDGILDVTVSSIWGDFYVGDSVLTVYTEDVAVPEPSIAGLMGLGLAGLLLSRRRARA